MRFLVTGASGFIGSHLSEFLVASGFDVVCPVRNLCSLRYLKGILVKIVALDALESLVVNEGPFDYVIHLAAATRGLNYHDYWVTNVDFTRWLLELFSRTSKDNPLKRFVLVSSQAAAGPSSPDGRPVLETDPPKPISLYGKSKLEAEQVAGSFTKKMPITIVRPPTVFGPRDVDVLGVFKCAQHRFVPYIAGPDRLVSLIYVKDLVDGIVAAALSPAANGKTYFIANPAPVVWRKFALQIAQVMGCRVVALPMPESIIKFVAQAGDAIGRLRGTPTLFRYEKFEEMKQIAWVCSSEKAKKDFQWTACTSVEEAIKNTAQWYKESGWL